MKHKLQNCLLISACLVMMVLICGVMNSGAAQQKSQSSPATSPQEKRTITAFENRVKQYLKLRDRVKGRVPKLSKDSTPEQIQANEKAFVDGLRTARAKAKPGDIFTPDIATYIRSKVKTEFKESDRKEIRKVVLDDEIKPIPIRVNYPYPDENAFAEMPPTLLLKLPVLPKQVKYRYVGRNLFLVDTDNNLIVDYMPNALP